VTKKTLRNESTTSRVVSALRELISALDRRVPHAERPGEIRIARDAHKLRREAVARIDLLTSGWDDTCFNQELAEAIMTDDGGPPQSETPIVKRCLVASGLTVTPLA
jgi:hypothetical protein